jgi:threonine aldolase
MRLATAPWLGLLDGDVWLRNARHANAMAQRLWLGISKVDGVRLLAPVESNGVFATLPAGAYDRLSQKGWRFYPWESGYRLMCAWDTQPETVDRFVADVAASS